MKKLYHYNKEKLKFEETDKGKIYQSIIALLLLIILGLISIIFEM